MEVGDFIVGDLEGDCDSFDFNLIDENCVLLNDDRFFSRKQIRGFFGYFFSNEKKIKTRADNYSCRFSHLYINRPSFEGFIDSLCTSIKTYINNDALFGSESADVAGDMRKQTA